jgi:hypothetical protein
MQVFWSEHSFKLLVNGHKEPMKKWRFAANANDICGNRHGNI